MLPAVGGASLLIMATYLAGKIPVMFNWTLPTDAFKHCVNFSKVEKIISVSSFYDRVKSPVLDEYNKEGKFIFLEDLLKDGKITEKVGALVKSFYMPLPKIVGNENFHSLQNTAVILFTSGSESLPKAVSLTHENLIENISGAIEIFKIQKDDVLLGFLPPFHSFGFTVNTIMPLITGLRVVYTPDPNDAKTILEVIKNTKVTSITATPTFLKMIMNLASGDGLKTIRYVVVGAEKCPQAVFDRFSNLCPNGKILEGYGITECSPVVAINPIIGAKPGTVGKIIDCLDCKIVDVNDFEKDMLLGEQGMILVKGKSIFNGYLDEKIESPFYKEWYKTGDLGFLDSDGFLTITGRLKRFIKIAGEMISLPALEETIAKKYNTGEELEVAIEAIEKDGESKIAIFSIKNLDLLEVNKYMRDNGIPNLVKISEIIRVEEIPVMGTGKTDYKILKKMINFDEKKEIKYNFENIEETLINKISELTGIDNSKIEKNKEFGKDIHIDSIDVGELMIFIRKSYNIEKQIKVENIKTFGDLVEIVENKKK
ncbi:MAG: AMP-binding protein [Candidatus Gracilibacteria bacterium]|nr:AMP-binding protein [Candidatus Gracilibacteria bacterium]